MAQVATRMIYGKSPANAPVSKTLAPLAAKFQRETPCFWSYSIRPLGHCRNSKTECQNSTPFSRFFLSNFGLLFNFRVLYEDYFFKVIQVGARISKTYTATEPGQFRGLWLVSFHCQSTVAKVGQRAAVVYWAIWRISIVGPTLPSGYNHDEDIKVKGTFCDWTCYRRVNGIHGWGNLKQLQTKLVSALFYHIETKA